MLLANRFLVQIDSICKQHSLQKNHIYIYIYRLIHLQVGVFQIGTGCPSLSFEIRHFHTLIANSECDEESWVLSCCLVFVWFCLFGFLILYSSFDMPIRGVMKRVGCCHVVLWLCGVVFLVS